MSLLQNAVVIGSNGDISLQRVSVPDPGPSEILVKVVAAAQNPSDWMAMKWGKVAGATIGIDFAGYVERVGSDVPQTLRTVGERVCGFQLSGWKPNCSGAFAEYVVAQAHFVIPIPLSWSFEDASQLGLTPFTALQALYESIQGLPTPESPTTDATPILVYGASTSVGIFAVQFAKLSGMRVVATASPANFALVKSFGADDVFDYKDPNVSKQIREATQGKLKYAVDCISKEETVRIVVDAFGEEGGEIGVVLQAKSPQENVKATFNLVFEWIGKDYDLPYPFKAKPEHKARGERFLKMYSDLLAAGKIKPGPIRVMPGGLAAVPEGIQHMLDGKISGVKLVYRISDTPLK